MCGCADGGACALIADAGRVAPISGGVWGLGAALSVGTNGGGGLVGILGVEQVCYGVVYLGEVDAVQCFVHELCYAVVA